jgi:hypothetical protein
LLLLLLLLLLLAIKAIENLRISKSVGVDDIPGFIIRGCTDIFVCVPKVM